MCEGQDALRVLLHPVELRHFTRPHMRLPVGQDGLGVGDIGLQRPCALVDLSAGGRGIDIADADDRFRQDAAQVFGAEGVVAGAAIVGDDPIVVGNGGKAERTDPRGHKGEGGDKRQNLGFDSHGVSTWGHFCFGGRLTVNV